MTWNTGRIRTILAMILLSSACLAIVSRGFAEDRSPDSIHYRRVFVPSEDLPLLGPEFVPIDIEDFESLMKNHSEQSAPPLNHSTPQLTQAIYVASMLGQDLVSDASRFSVTCQSDTPRLFAVTPCTLAIRQVNGNMKRIADSTREGFAVDSQPFRYDLQGSPIISVKQPTDFWFGWTVHGEATQDSSRLKYKLDIPRCLDSRLLILLPPMWRVDNASCVARPLDDAVSLLGPSWPTNIDVDGEPNWWSIELSGSTSAEFDLVQSVEAFQLSFDHLILRERVDYRLLPSGLEVISDFQLANSLNLLSELTLRIAPGLHISSIALDERPMEWRPSHQPFCIDIINTEPTDDHKPFELSHLVIRGLAAWPLADGNSTLPTIQIEKAFSVDGVGSLAFHQDWTVHQVQIANGHVFSRSGTTQLGGLGRWDFEWTKGPPSITLHATPRTQIGRAESLTRLSNDGDSLIATTWVTVAANSNPRSSLRLNASPGWVVESVQSTERRYTTNFQKVPNTDNSEWEIQITPAIENQPLTLEIRTRSGIVAGPENPSLTSLNFKGDRPMTFRDLRQSDIYWIEPTGRYKIEANPELLQCQIDIQQVPEIQRQRLPRIGDVWLIKPDGSKLPRLTFRRQAAPYSVQLETKIEPSLQGIAAKYRLKCVPLAGAVSSVTMDIDRLADIPIRWRQLKKTPDGDDQWTGIESQNIRRETKKALKNAEDSTATNRVIRVNLPTPMSEAFELEGDVEFAWTSNQLADVSTIRIPLPSLPEAAQEDATLQIDHRLALIDWDENAPWTPLGYVESDRGHRTRRYRYDPIRVSSIDIKPELGDNLPNHWMTDFVTRYRYYLDGQRECLLHAQLHASDPTSIDVDFPSGWRLRKASLDGQSLVVIEDPQSLNRIRIWIPRLSPTRTSSEISLAFDGPSDLLHHRDLIEMPSILPSCPILDYRYELWLPPSLGVHSPTSSLHREFPRLDLSKLWPARWYYPLIRQESRQSEEVLDNNAGAIASSSAFDSSQPRRVWSTELIDEVRSNPRSLMLIVNQSKRALDWTIVFAGFTITLCLAQLRKSLLAITGLALMFGILATTDRVLETIQLTSLGWIIGSVLLILHACHRPKESINDRSFHSADQQKSRSKGTGQGSSMLAGLSGSKTRTRFSNIWLGWILLLVSLGTGPTVQAQPPSDKVYHVVLPVDSNDEFTSKVVYASEELLQKLYQRQKDQAGLTQLVSARYGLRLVGYDSRSAYSTVLLTLRYEVDIQDLNQPVVWPLRVRQAKFVSLFVDGSEIPLGSRLRWNEDILQWTPPNRGLAQIELTVAAIMKRELDGRLRIEVDVLPVAGAQLEIEADEMDNVQTNALGQVLNPASGHIQAALGPQPKLVVTWQKSEEDGRLAMPSASVEDEFALLGDSVLARTKIDIDDSTFQPGSFDIECDSGWQPLGRIWGAAILLDSVPATSNTRRRYRLRWDGTHQDDRDRRTIVIHWVASNPRISLLNLPEIEVPGIRIHDSSIRFFRGKDSEWTFEGLQSWTKTESLHHLEWYPRSGDNISSYHRPSNAPPAFLRRSASVAQKPATMETELRFLPNQVHSKTVVTFELGKIRRPDLLLTFPLNVEIQTVRANQVEIPFSIFKIDAKQIQLQVFLDPDADVLESIVIESVQLYEDQSWMEPPLPTLENFLIDEHTVSTTRMVNQLVEWQGFDASTIVATPAEARSRGRLPPDTSKSLEVNGWSFRLAKSPKDNDTSQSSTETSQIPLESFGPRYRVLRSTESNSGYVVSRLIRKTERWSFHVHGLVDAGNSPIDGVLMEVPLSMLESLSCSHRMARFSSPEIGKQLIFVFSDEPMTGKAFEFELTSNLPPIESSATTTLPEIRMMGNYEWQQWLMVPRSIANQETRWSLTGARTVDATTIPDFAKARLNDVLGNSLVVVPTTDRPSVRLSNVAANPLPIALRMAVHEVVLDLDHTQSVASSFYFIPRGQLRISVELPAACKLLAVECNGRSVPESSIALRGHDTEPISESKRTMDIRLLSSSMPQKITVHTQRHPPSAEKGLGLQDLAAIIDASAEQTLFTLHSQDGVTCSGLKTIDAGRTQELLAQSVLELAEQAEEFIAEAPLTERLQWWHDWQSSTHAIWQDATRLRDQDLLVTISDRRRALLERLQLPSRGPVFGVSSTAKDPLHDNSMGWIASPSLSNTQIVKEYFAMDPDTTSISTMSIQPRVVTKSNVGNPKVWLSWSLWFLSAALAIRITYRRFDDWIGTCKSYILNRPWMLFVGLGILSFSLAPILWYGPAMIAVGLYFVVRTYWHEINRVSR